MSGRPAEAVTPTMVANVEVCVNKNRRGTLQEVATSLALIKCRHIRAYTKN